LQTIIKALYITQLRHKQFPVKQNGPGYGLDMSLTILSEWGDHLAFKNKMFIIYSITVDNSVLLLRFFYLIIYQ
jgi:hypothetical protein